MKATLSWLLFHLCGKLIGHTCLFEHREGHSLLSFVTYRQCLCGLMRCRTWKLRGD
jgi:hypothetical protein